MTTDDNDIVFDPFCGGGSAAVASKQLGRRYIGVEIDKNYCEISRKKFSEAQPIKQDGMYVSVHLGRIVSMRDIDTSIIQ